MSRAAGDRWLRGLVSRSRRYTNPGRQFFRRLEREFWAELLRPVPGRTAAVDSSLLLLFLAEQSRLSSPEVRVGYDELAEVSGLARSTCQCAVERLIDAGRLVRTSPSPGGGRPHRYKVRWTHTAPHTSRPSPLRFADAIVGTEDDPPPLVSEQSSARAGSCDSPADSLSAALRQSLRSPAWHPLSLGLLAYRLAARLAVSPERRAPVVDLATATGTGRRSARRALRRLERAELVRFERGARTARLVATSETLASLLEAEAVHSGARARQEERRAVRAERIEERRRDVAVASKRGSANRRAERVALARVRGAGPLPWELEAGKEMVGDGVEKSPLTLADRQQVAVEELVDRIVEAVRDALKVTPRDRIVGTVEPEDEWQAAKWLVDELGWPGDWEREREWALDELELEIFGEEPSRADVGTEEVSA